MALELIKALEGAAADYDFTAIPDTFESLLVMGKPRSDTGVAATGHRCDVNGDGAAGSYLYRGLGNTSYLVGAAQELTAMVAGGSTAGHPGHVTMWIHHYANAALNTIIDITGSDWRVGLGGHNNFNWAMMWVDPAVVDRLRFYPAVGSYTAASGMALYGLG